MEYGMTLSLQRALREEMHFHQEIELLYVVTGETDVNIQEKKYHLENGGIVLINSGIQHAVDCGADTILCVLRYSYRLLAEILPENSDFFKCNSTVEDGQDFKRLQDLIRKCIFQYIRKNRKTKCLLDSRMLQVLDLLAENFLVDAKKDETLRNSDDYRLQQMITYVNRHYREGINLSVLAEECYVSSSTLSRFFKKQTGVYFASYVNQVKCRYAAMELVYTDKSITKIAVDNGYSNPSVFNRIFRELYEMTPLEYRKCHSQSLQAEEEAKRQEQESLMLELTELEQDPDSAEQELQVGTRVTVDAWGGTSYRKMWSQAITVGAAQRMTLANVQFHVLYLAEQLGLKYIRLWSIFSKNMMLTDGVHIGNYNYDILDGVLDFLVEHHLYPFLDFGKRPDVIVKTENIPVYEGSESVDFASREAWEAMFADFVRHILQRYGRTEVSNWIFEFSRDGSHNELSRYYQCPGKEYDFYQVYAFAYEKLRRACPEAKIGGPGGISGFGERELEDFLLHCREDDKIPDFISFILFPYETRCENDRSISEKAAMASYEREQVERMLQLRRRVKLEQCELYISEWNCTISNRNFLNDSCFRAAYMARKIADVWDQVDMMIPWVATDWVSNYYDVRGIAMGGNGILTKDMIRKPAFFALDFLNRLGDQVLSVGTYHIATRKEQTFYILFFHYKWFSYRYFLDEQRTDRPEHLRDLFENTEPVKLELVLDHLPEGADYIIKYHTINEEHGSFLTEWSKFQYDYRLENNDVKYIRDCCFPRVSMVRKNVQDGKLKLNPILQPHEITLVQISADY